MIDASRLGRFDQSFIVRMIKDFFLLLLVVAALELGIRFTLVLYDFYEKENTVTRVAAERLASDVRRIMMNSGGPVAARTLYPIIRDNLEARGLLIAVEPTDLTKRSIEKIFSFTPKGIPPLWPDGRHHETTLEIEAEKFCLRCHANAKVGDPLGRVTVRNYLSTHLTNFWREVRLTGVMILLKIILHTMVLFFLLKVRMEPVLTLRTVVGDLARGASDLSLRAPVRSTDEFGELATDLNRFLDRLCHILDDLGAVLARVAALNQRLEEIQNRSAGRFERIGERLATAMRETVAAGAGEPLLTAEWLQTAAAARALAERALARSGDKAELGEHFDLLFDQLEDAARGAKRLLTGVDNVGNSLAALSDEVRGFSHFMGEMAILEEKMQAIAESGQTLVERLKHSGHRQES